MTIPRGKLNIHNLLFWIALSSGAPFILYAWPGHPHKILIFLLIVLFSGFIIIKGKYVISIYAILPLFVMLLYSIFRSIYDETYSLTIPIQCAAFLIMYIYLVNFVKIERFAKTFIILMILMGIGGTLIFFINLFIGINPIFQVEYSPENTTYFLGLTTTNTYVNQGSFRFLRYAGFFDEPGAYGLYAMYALILNKEFFNNKRYERFLLFLPLFCFSLAFYIVVFLYSFLFLLNKRSLKYFILFFGIMIALVGYLSSLDRSNQSNNELYELTIGRFERDSDGNFVNESRVDGDKAGKIAFKKNPLLGDGKTTGASIYLMLASNGIIGSILQNTIWVVYLFLILKIRKGRFLHFKLLFLVLISYYARPGIDMLSLMVAFALIHSILPKKRVGEYSRQRLPDYGPQI